MKNTKKVSYLFLIVSMVLFGFPAYGHSGKERMIDRMSHKLELNEKQKSSVGTILDDMKKTMKTMKKNAKKTRATLIETLSADSIDTVALFNSKETINTMHAERLEYISKKVLEIHAILEPEQRKKAGKILAKMFQKKDGKKKRRGKKYDWYDRNDKHDRDNHDRSDQD